MSKKFPLHINGTPYNIEADGKFATYLKATMKEDFNLDGNNDIKVIIQAYIRKNQEIFKKEERAKTILNSIDLD